MVNGHPVAGEVFGHVIADVVVFVGEHPVGTVEQVHFRLLEIGKDGGEFTADDAGADDENALGEVFQRQNAVGVDDAYPVGFQSRVFTGFGACSNQKVGAGNYFFTILSGYPHASVVDKGGPALHQGDAPLLRLGAG